MDERDFTLKRTGKLLALCALALAGPGLVAGCGGDDEDPEELLREAFGQEMEYDSGVINIGLDGSLEGVASGAIDADINGPFQSGAEGEPPELQLEANAAINAEGIPDLPGGAISFDFTGGFGLAGDALFVAYQDTTYEASEELYSAIQPLLETAQGAGDTTQDPESADEFIDALDNLENEGTEEIEGESTTHVSGDFDFAALVEEGAATSGVPFDTSQLEGFTSTVDVYVAEADNSFRRIDFGFSADEVAALAASGIEALDLTLSVGISEPNTEQTIEAPTGTEPLDDLLRQFGTSEAEILEALEGGLVPAVPGAGAEGGGAPGGTAGDPEVQACIAEATTSNEILDCLSS